MPDTAATSQPLHEPLWRPEYSPVCVPKYTQRPLVLVQALRGTRGNGVSAVQVSLGERLQRSSQYHPQDLSDTNSENPACVLAVLGRARRWRCCRV